MERFVAFDVETANENRSSICQIGLAFFENGQLVETWESLVNPKTYFADMNIAIHKISPEDIVDAPTLEELTPLLKQKFNDWGTVVSYSVFDKQAFEQAQLGIDFAHWVDVMSVARRTWEVFAHKGYGLKSVSKYLGISNTLHHHALNDAIVCGHIFARALQDLNCDIKEIFKRDWHTLRYLKRKGKYADTPEAAERKPNPEGILFGEVVVFTGAMTYSRAQLEDIALQAGCDVGKGVTKKTTLLVQGIQDPDKIKGELSNKEMKTLALIEKGVEIRIISEQNFLDMIKGEIE